MRQFTVDASVTSSPTNVSLTVNNIKIRMARDDGGAWAGHKASIELPESFGFAFAAVGPPNARWTLEITVSTPDGTQVTDYKHDGKIPSNMLSAYHDTISLSS